MTHVFRRHRSCCQGRVARGVRRNAAEIHPDRLEARGVCRVGVRFLREVVRERELTGEIGIGDVGDVGLRRQNAPLQCDQRRVVGLEPARYARIVVSVFRVLVEAQTGNQPQAISEFPFELAEGSGAEVRVVDDRVRS